MKLNVLIAYWKLKRAAKRLERAKTMDKKYSAATTLWKALIAFLVTLGATNAAVLSAVEIPATWDQFKAQWPTLLISLIVAALKAYANWRKNRDKKDDAPHPLVPSAGIVLLCALTGLMGCKTWVDSAGTRHFAADWEIINQSREDVRPYIKEGVAMALRYYEAKQQDKEAVKEQRMRRAALFGGAVAFANEYRQNQDVEAAKEAANTVLVALGVDAKIEDLAVEAIMSPSAERTSDFDLMVEVLTGIDRIGNTTVVPMGDST